MTIPAETLAWLKQTAKFDGATTAQVLLVVLERLEALEDECAESMASDAFCVEAIVRRLEALEQRPIPGTVELATPTPEAAPVATDEELLVAWNRAGQDGFDPALRAVYDLGRQHGAAQPPATQPAAPPATAGLLARVMLAIDGSNDLEIEARAAIREVAAWMEDHEHAFHAAYWLEQEASRA